jgi:hypothetical protein
VRNLGADGFIVQQRNVVLVGGTGAGKTHLGIRGATRRYYKLPGAFFS